jgi:hypothetical protein
MSDRPKLGLVEPEEFDEEEKEPDQGDRTAAGRRNPEDMVWGKSAIRPCRPRNSIRGDSRDEAESAHHPARCLRSSGCLGRLSLTCLGRGGGLKLRTSFSDISLILP